MGKARSAVIVRIFYVSKAERLKPNRIAYLVDIRVRIGTAGTHNTTFISGISGVTTGLAGTAVVIDINGQLGTISSSARFKEDINDMGDNTSGLMKLRPVTFRYKESHADGSQPIQYGFRLRTSMRGVRMRKKALKALKAVGSL